MPGPSPTLPAGRRMRGLLTCLTLAALGLGVGLSAAEIGAKIPVVVPMVRIVVATDNAAVQQTYELEIDSFDGHSLKGFEPEQAAGSVRALISISMASVRSLEFFQRTIERPAPAAARPDPGERNPPTAREPSKELQRRFDHLLGEGGEGQLLRVFEVIKSPQEFRQLQEHLVQQMDRATTPEELQTAVRAATLCEFLYNCFAAARNFQHTTSAQYFAQIPQMLKEAQTETAQSIRKMSSEEGRKNADKVLNAQDLRLISKPLAERVWNQTVPAERTVDLSTARRFGNGPNGPKGYKNPRPGRPPE